MSGGHISYHLQRATYTAVAGAASGTVKLYHSHAKMALVIIKADTSSTTFDVAMTDMFGNTVYESINNTGELRDLPDIPSYGSMTLSISNSSDLTEGFTQMIAFEEGV
jgi:hypothetical protein